MGPFFLYFFSKGLNDIIDLYFMEVKMANTIITEDAFQMLLRIRLDGGTMGFLSEHKEQFKQTVTEPLKELARVLEPTIKDINPQIVTNPNKVVSRPYRDARYNLGKPPVRDFMYIFFKHELKKNDPLRIHIRITPEGMFFGMGIMPVPSYMKEEHKRILANPARFINIIDNIKPNRNFKLHEDLYKKPPLTSQDARVMEWLFRKNFWYISELSIKEALSDDLVNILSTNLLQFKELFNFLIFN